MDYYTLGKLKYLHHWQQSVFCQCCLFFIIL